MDVGPIPWTAIHEYATILFDVPEEIEDFHYLIRELDNEYASWRAEQHKELAK